MNSTCGSNYIESVGKENFQEERGLKCQLTGKMCFTHNQQCFGDQAGPRDIEVRRLKRVSQRGGLIEES